MAGATGSWTDSVGGGVSDAYNFGGYDGWSGFFGDALGAWVTVEQVKAQTGSSAAAQEATRTATNYPSGSVPQTTATSGGGSMGGITPQQAMVGGVLLLGLVLLIK